LDIKKCDKFILEKPGCSQLIHIVQKKHLFDESWIGLFLNKMNNLQTVPRLGVDKFISSSIVVHSAATAYELINTLRLEAEEENYSSFYFKIAGNISLKER